jgi:3-deoxy-D-manno-octulosonic-acid transferase
LGRPVIRIPALYVAAGTLAGFLLRRAGSGRTGPWPSSLPDSVWIHCASLGESKGVLALLRLLPAGLPVTLTSTTVAGRDRLRDSGFDAFLLPCDDRRTVREFLAARRIRRALFLEAEAWPVVLEELGGSGIPTAFAAFRTSPRSMRRWKALGKVFPGWTQTVDAVWTDRPEAVEAVRALGFSDVRPGTSLKWAGVPVPDAGGTGPEAAISLHLRDLPTLWVLVRSRPGRGWLWFPRRPRQAAMFRLGARLSGLRAVARPSPGPGQVYVSPRFGEVAGLLPGCRSAWVSPGHDTEEPFHLGVGAVSTGHPTRNVPRPVVETDSVATGIAAWISQPP